MVTDLLNLGELEVNTVYPVPSDTQQQIKDFHIKLVGEYGVMDYPYITNYFHAGMYAREMLMPKGTLIIGRIHLEDHLCMITGGIVDVITSSGKARYCAPFVIETKAMTQRVLFSVEDCTITTIHKTQLKNADEIIDAYTTEDYTVLGGNV